MLISSLLLHACKLTASGCLAEAVMDLCDGTRVVVAEQDVVE